MHRIHYVYLLTRALPEGGSMYYVGIRTCPVGKSPATDTSYMGSGRRITRAVRKHRSRFTKTIVDVFDTRAEARAMERALVGLATANSPWSYNLREGGEDRGLLSEETKAKIGTTHKRLATEDPTRREQLRAMQEASQTPEAREKRSAGNRRRYQRETADERADRIEKATERSRKLAKDPAWLDANAAANRAKAQDLAWLEATTARNRAQARDLAWLEANAAAAGRPETRRKKSASGKRRFAAMTDDERAAHAEATREGIRRAKAERERIRRETTIIFLALVAAQYGDQEHAA